MEVELDGICDLGTMKLTSPSTIKYIMGKYGFRFSKSLGQNFLISENVVEKIIEGSEIHENDCVVEVGPGIGVMTRALSERAHKVVSFEIDKSLIPVLGETLGKCNNVRLVFEDVLRADVKSILTEEFGDRRAKVVANLPYYVTTPIIMMFFENDLNISDITVMVQKEVALRMMAKPGTKEYGTLSLAVQFYSEPQIIASAPKGCFMPSPNVDSSVIRLKESPFKFKEELLSKETFFEVVKASFSKRRKTIINSMSGELGISKEGLKECLAFAGIEENRRGETLNLDEFGVLSNKVYLHRRKENG